MSGTKRALADVVESALARQRARASRSSALGAQRVARTDSGAAERVVLGGHLDTVPRERQRSDRAANGDVLHGLGSAPT